MLVERLRVIEFSARVFLATQKNDDGREGKLVSANEKIINQRSRSLSDYNKRFFIVRNAPGIISARV
jgi:hypothetical protein